MKDGPILRFVVRQGFGDPTRGLGRPSLSRLQTRRTWTESSAASRWPVRLTEERS